LSIVSIFFQFVISFGLQYETIKRIKETSLAQLTILTMSSYFSSRVEKEQAAAASKNHLQPLGIDETFGRLKDVFLQRWAFFLSIAAVAVLLQNLLAWVVPIGNYGDAAVFDGNNTFYSEYESMYDDVENEAAEAVNGDGGGHRRRWLEDAVAAYDMNYNWYGIVGTIALLIVKLVLHYIIVSISNGALIRAASELYLSRFPSPLEVISCAFGRFVPLVGTSLVLFVALMVPASALFFGSVVLANAYNWYALPILVVLVFVIAMCWVTIGTYVSGQRVAKPISAQIPCWRR
jgi:hypothetical protein